MLIFSETTAVIITVIILIGIGWHLVRAARRLWHRHRDDDRDHDHRDDPW